MKKKVVWGGAAIMLTYILAIASPIDTPFFHMTCQQAFNTADRNEELQWYIYGFSVGTAHGINKRFETYVVNLNASKLTTYVYAYCEKNRNEDLNIAILRVLGKLIVPERDLTNQPTN